MDTWFGNVGGREVDFPIFRATSAFLQDVCLWKDFHPSIEGDTPMSDFGAPNKQYGLGNFLEDLEGNLQLLQVGEISYNFIRLVVGNQLVSWRSWIVIAMPNHCDLP